MQNSTLRTRSTRSLANWARCGRRIPRCARARSLPRGTAEPGLFAFSRDRARRTRGIPCGFQHLAHGDTFERGRHKPTGRRQAGADFRFAHAEPLRGAETLHHGCRRRRGARELWRRCSLPCGAPPRRCRPRARRRRSRSLKPAAGATLAFSQRETDGQIFPTRQEIRAEVTGGDGYAEVAFAPATRFAPRSARIARHRRHAAVSGVLAADRRPRVGRRAHVHRDRERSSRARGLDAD